MGSFDPTLSAMTPVQFLGTHLANGQPANGTACVKGFDQASFMIGTVSSLFNVRALVSFVFVLENLTGECLAFRSHSIGRRA
jgi:hypothetical protein